MKKLLPRSVFARYFISYVLIMALLFAGIGLYAIISFDSAIRKNIIDTNTNRLGILRAVHEEKLSTLLDISNQISLSPYISPFKFQDDPLKAFHLKQQLSAFNAANNFCDQIYLTFIGDDYLYSSATSVSIDLFTEKMIQYENYTSVELSHLLRTEHTMPVFLPGQKINSKLANGLNTEMTTTVVPIRLDGYVTIGNLLFFIEDGIYQKLFRDEIEEPRDMFIFHNGDLLSSSRRLHIPPELVADTVYSIEENDTDTVRNLSVNGENYMLFVQQGNILEMQYVLLMPQETVSMQIIRSRVTFCLFLFLFSIPCSLLIIFFTKRHTRPIRKLRNNFGIETSTRDEFTVIQEGIETLIGQNTNLHTSLSQSISVRRSDFVRKFIKTRYGKRQEAVEAAAALSLHIDKAFFIVVLIAADLGDHFDPGNLNELAGNSDGVSGCGVEIVSQEQSLLILFSDSKELLLDWANSARIALAAEDRDATVAISSICDDFLKADSLYLEACAAYDNRFIMGIEHVLTFTDINISASSIDTFTKSYLDAFRQAVNTNNGYVLNEQINELFRALSENNFSIFTFRLILNELINILLAKCSANGIAVPSALLYYDIFTLSRYRRLSDLSTILIELCREILSSVETTADKNDVPTLSHKITEYMRENQTDPSLTMSSIADFFEISTTQLSLIYKNQTGIHPSAYLLMLRIEQAKDLLSNTDMPIKEIAVIVGYYDASGFIRRFKQQTGFTPNQYRQSLRKDDTLA